MSIADDLSRIAVQEQHLQFTTFDEETAWSLGKHLRALAVARKLKLVIDIRRFGQPLFFTALSGTTPDNIEWIRRKSNVTSRFHRSSYAIGLEMEQKKSNLLDRYGLAVSDYAGHGGSFPLCVSGAGVIGSVTVSGLPQRGDHELAVEALCAELGCPIRPVAPRLEPRLLWPDKDREVWFSLGENHEKAFCYPDFLQRAAR